MKFFFAYIKQRAAVFAVFLVFAAVFAVVFALYDLPLKAVIYPFMLCAFLGIVFVAVDGSWMMKGTPDEIKEKCRSAVAAAQR